MGTKTWTNGEQRHDQFVSLSAALSDKARSKGYPSVKFTINRVNNYLILDNVWANGPPTSQYTLLTSPTGRMRLNWLLKSFSMMCRYLELDGVVVSYRNSGDVPRLALHVKDFNKDSSGTDGAHYMYARDPLREQEIVNVLNSTKRAVYFLRVLKYGKV